MGQRQETLDAEKDRTPLEGATEVGYFMEEDGQGTLFEKAPQRRIEVSSPVFEKRNLLRNAVTGLSVVGEVFRWLLGDLHLLQEKGSPVLRREAKDRLEKLNQIATDVIPTLEESLKDLGELKIADLGEDTTEERLQELLQDTPLEKLRKIDIEK